MGWILKSAIHKTGNNTCNKTLVIRTKYCELFVFIDLFIDIESVASAVGIPSVIQSFVQKNLSAKIVISVIDDNVIPQKAPSNGSKKLMPENFMAYVPSTKLKVNFESTLVIAIKNADNANFDIVFIKLSFIYIEEAWDHFISVSYQKKGRTKSVAPFRGLGVGFVMSQTHRLRNGLITVIPNGIAIGNLIPVTKFMT